MGKYPDDLPGLSEEDDLPIFSPPAYKKSKRHQMWVDLIPEAKETGL